MNTNRIHTVTSLNLLTLKEITEMVNGFQVELNLKVTKRFTTKPAAVKKALDLHGKLGPQDETPEVDADLVEPLDAEIINNPTPKAVKTTLDLEATVTILSDNPKGTIENFIHSAIVEGYDTVESLAGEIVDVHTLARSGNKVDMKYALRNIKLFADRNSIKIGK